jgi:AraC-like DNA-binding protein
MRAVVDHRGYALLSTDEVAEQDAFAFWRDMICATFVRLRAEPVSERGFDGRIEHVAVGDLELSTVAAAGQQVERTRRLIADAGEEYVLGSIQLAGRGVVEQDGRAAVIESGDLAFYDSTRPYTLHFDQPFRQLVVQVPRRQIDVRDTRSLTARTLGAGTPGAVVAAFARSLAEAARAEPSSTALLFPHAVALVSAAASYAGSLEPVADAAEAMARQRVLAFMQAHVADAALDADTIARACHVSRRTLYRIVGEDGVARRLRQLRIEQACRVLVTDPSRPIGAVAAACGFESESGFYRAFRGATGTTPAEYRNRYGTSGA